MQNKRPLNENLRAHGYWEIYYSNEQLHFKAFFNNGLVFGPYESYSVDGSLTLKCSFHEEIIYGFCEHLTKKMYYAR